VSLGLEERFLGLSWLAGPVSGLLVQPIAGSLSDRSECRWGRRRPFLVGGLACTLVSMAVFASAQSIGQAFGDSGSNHSIALMVAVISSFGDDIAKNAVQGPLRALASDICPPEQLPTANALFTAMIGIGQFSGFLAGSEDLTRLFPWLFWWCPTRYHAVITLAGIVLTVGVLCTVFSVKERPWKNSPQVPAGDAPPQPEEKRMGTCLWWLCAAVAASWLGMFIFMIFASSWMAVDVFQGNKGDADYNQGIELAAKAMAGFALTTSLSSVVVGQPSLVRHSLSLLAVSQLGGAVCMVAMASTTSRETGTAAIVFCGVSFATLMAVPFHIAGEMAGVSDGGKFVGIINAAIVIPQLVVCMTSGFIVEQSAGSFRQLFRIGAACSCVAAVLVFGPLARAYSTLGRTTGRHRNWR